MFLSVLDAFAEEMKTLYVERSGRIDPSSGWELIYQEYVVKSYSEAHEGAFSPNRDKLYQLKIGKIPVGAEQSRLTVDYVKKVESSMEHYCGTMLCRQDAWSSILEWEYQYDLNRDRWFPYSTGHRQSGVQHNDQVVIHSKTFPSGIKVYPDISRLIGGYALVDALMRGGEVPGEFCYLEDFTLIHPKMEMFASDMVRDGAAAGMKRHVLYGNTNLPTEFWRDEEGLIRYICVGPQRLLALVSAKGVVI